jgi:sugar-specific transcriptional regulator TrmB
MSKVIENRIDRLENKVDSIKEDVTELKVDMKHLMPKIEEHITGDKKIISHLAPVLDKLPALIQIVEEDQFEKMKKKERAEKRNNLIAKLTVLSMIIGIGAGLTKILGITIF